MHPDHFGVGVGLPRSHDGSVAVSGEYHIAAPDRLDRTFAVRCRDSCPGDETGVVDRPRRADLLLLVVL